MTWRGPLQRAVHRGGGGIELGGDLGGGEPEHLAQDEHGPLEGGQALQGGDEGELDAFPRQVGRLG